jgi:hypothetical protein
MQLTAYLPFIHHAEALQTSDSTDFVMCSLASRPHPPVKKRHIMQTFPVFHSH